MAPIDLYEDMALTELDEVALEYHELMDAAITRRSGNASPKEQEPDSDSDSEDSGKKACKTEACKCKASKFKVNKAKACKTKACKCKGCHSETRAREALIRAATAGRNKRP
jgi:hypothetical protein